MILYLVITSRNWVADPRTIPQNHSTRHSGSRRGPADHNSSQDDRVRAIVPHMARQEVLMDPTPVVQMLRGFRSCPGGTPKINHKMRKKNVQGGGDFIR